MIISILSPKGGSGKSTAALILATMFADDDRFSTALVDADPRQSIARIWQGKRDEAGLAPASFSIFSSVSDDTILDTLEAADAEHDIVFVDLEGTAGLMTSYAAAGSDLCLIPMRPSALDGDAATSALKMIHDTGRASRREIPSLLLLTQTSAALATTSYREICAELEGEGIARLASELIQRAAFERVMAEGKTLLELNHTASVAKAIENARFLARELATTIAKLETNHAA